MQFCINLSEMVESKQKTMHDSLRLCFNSSKLLYAMTHSKKNQFQIAYKPAFIEQSDYSIFFEKLKFCKKDAKFLRIHHLRFVLFITAR